MAARRKPVTKPIEPKESVITIEVPIGNSETIAEQPEHIDVKESTIHTLVIPERMYERMRNIGNDEYWLRIIDNHIEIMMTRYHQ